MPELVFYLRGEEVLRVGLERQRVVLGRGEDCDVVIPDPHVSRQQVALLLDGSRCRVEDLSGQGTEVAGQSMRHGELPDGADLKLGPWRAVFRQRGTAGTAGPTRRELRTDVQSREAPEDGLPPAQVRVKQGTTELLHPIGAGSFTVQPFVPINCGALSPAVIESELFSHEKGAFTGADSRRRGAFEEAQGGALFLDEVGELPLELLARLLRVLDSGEVKPVGDKLQQHPWPGNVRELRNVVHRALLVRKGPRLEASDILFEEPSYRAPEDTEGVPLELPEGVTLEQMMQRVERQLVESALRRCGNHKDRAAKALGIARSSLFKRLKEWGLGQGEE